MEETIMNNSSTQEAILSMLQDIRKATLLASKDLLTTEECSMLTGFTEQTIRVYACNRKIPHYKKGGRLVFSKREIENWMLKDRVKTLDDIDREANQYMMRKGRCKISAKC